LTRNCWTENFPSSSNDYTKSFRKKGLIFHRPCHIGDEWAVPVGVPSIFAPFFLMYDRLRQLQKKIILDIEGDTDEWFMKLIRHEAAHSHA
jgi:hypothetical protein